MTSVVTLLSCLISISLGIPTLLNTAINASATRSVSTLGNVTASGYSRRVVYHCQIYRDFLSDRGSIGPTISSATRLNGVSINGIFPKGTLVTRPFWRPLTNVTRFTKSSHITTNSWPKKTQIQLCPMFSWCLDAQSTKFRVLISELSHENPQGPQVAK